MKQTSQIAEAFASNRNRLIRNNLFLVSGLNFLTLVIFIIGVSVPNWFFFKLPSSKVAEGVWINLLFVYDSGSSYVSFQEAVTRYCNPRDSCETAFEQFGFIGTFVFCIFILGNALQLYDLVRVLTKAFRQSKFSGSNKFRHFLTIGTFLLGISIYIFSVFFVESITDSHFGACFYAIVASLVILVGTIVYERQSMRRMAKQEMLIRLLEDQRRIAQEDAGRLSSDSFIM